MLEGSRHFVKGVWAPSKFTLVFVCVCVCVCVCVARTVVAHTVIEECMVGSCREHNLFQGLPCEINLYLEVALSGKALKLYY